MPSTVTETLSLSLVAEKVKSSSSTSKAESVNVRDPSSSIAWSAIDAITGASLIGLTVIDATPILDESNPSETLYSIKSVPLKSAFEEYVIVKPFIESIFPLEGLVIIITDNWSSSTSKAGIVKEVDESSSKSIITSSTIGASFTAETIMSKSWLTLNSPSETSTFTTVLPYQSTVGVKDKVLLSSETSPLPAVTTAL